MPAARYFCFAKSIYGFAIRYAAFGGEMDGHCLPDKRKFEHFSKVTNRAK